MFGMTALPAPYDDELIGSAIVRGTVWAGRALSAIFKELGISGPDVSYFLPVRLARLAEAVGLEAAALLQRHTCFPYSTFYKDEALVHNFARRLSSRESQHDSKLIGFLRAFALQPPALRYCPECVEQEIQTNGETYWHRSHNLPLVQTCCFHEVPLWQLPPCGRSLQQYNQGLPTLRRGTRLRIAPDAAIAHALTLRSVEILRGGARHSPSDREQTMRLKGYLFEPRRFSNAQLSEDLRSFYGSFFLETIGYGISDPRHGWPRFLLQQQRGGTANNEVLLDVFLLNGAAAPHTWKCKTGLAPAPPDIDAELTRLFQDEVAALLAAGMTAPLHYILYRIGARPRYYGQRSLYPQLSAAIAHFRVSPARKTSQTPRQPPYWLHNKFRRRPPPPAPPPRYDLSEEDAINSKLLRAAIRKLRDEGGRSTVRHLIQGIGFWGRYSRGRTRYPKVAGIVDQFVQSLNSSRNYRRSQR